jgi:hypothetical protein
VLKITDENIQTMLVCVVAFTEDAFEQPPSRERGGKGKGTKESRRDKKEKKGKKKKKRKASSHKQGQCHCLQVSRYAPIALISICSSGHFVLFLSSCYCDSLLLCAVALFLFVLIALYCLLLCRSSLKLVARVVLSRFVFMFLLLTRWHPEKQEAQEAKECPQAAPTRTGETGMGKSFVVVWVCCVVVLFMIH